MINTLADHVAGVHLGHPVRVAVDGITAAGKTTLAAELRSAVAARGRPAIHLSTDDYHYPVAHRRRDADPARGYYRDAYDLDAFRRLVLDPLGPGRNGRYRAQIHDLTNDESIDEPPETAPRDAVVIVDGSFLQVDALVAAWDVVIYVHASFENAAQRAESRDHLLFGDRAAVRSAYAARYHPACRLYLAATHAAERAAFLVDNDDVERPVLVRRPKRRAAGPAS